MLLSQARETVARFLETGGSGLMILKGAWGVGKTFFWKKTLEELSREGKIKHFNYSYISLFGVNSLESLKNSIVANQISSAVIGKDSNLSGSVLAARGKKIVSHLERIPKIRDFTGGLGSELAFQIVSDSIVCFDDLERRPKSLDIRDILGIASLLKEERGCKVVLVLNDEKLIDREEFGEHNEKVVDIELLFAPEPAEVFGYVFSETHAYHSLIKRCTEKLQIKNVRILQRIKRSIEDLSSSLANIESKVAEDIVRSTVLFVWSYYNRDTPSIPISFFQGFSSVSLYVRQEIRKEEIGKEEQGWYKLLNEYGFDHEDDVDRGLIRFIQNGYVDEDFRKSVSEKNEQEIAQKGKDSYSEAWGLFKTSFSLDGDTFIAKLVSGFRENEKYLSITDLYNTVDIIRRLGDEKQADSLIDEYVPKVSFEMVQELRRLPTFSDFKDERFLQKLSEIRRPEIEISFSDAIEKIQSENGIYGEHLDFLARSDITEYYEYFMDEKSGNIYWVAKLLLSACDVANDSHKSICRKTRSALLRVAAVSDINRLRIKDWFGLSQDSTDLHLSKGESTRNE